MVPEFVMAIFDIDILPFICGGFGGSAPTYQQNSHVAL
jgi:hypothetical protein